MFKVSLLWFLCWKAWVLALILVISSIFMSTDSLNNIHRCSINHESRSVNPIRSLSIIDSKLDAPSQYHTPQLDCHTAAASILTAEARHNAYIRYSLTHHNPRFFIPPIPYSPLIPLPFSLCRRCTLHRFQFIHRRPVTC